MSSAPDIAAAIAIANDNEYGLGAGIFTSDVAATVRAMRQIDAGNIHINWTPLWRAEMTEEKTVIIHGRPW